MKDQLRHGLDELAGQWASQPRLRLGAWLALALIGLNFVFVLGDIRREKAPEIQRMAAQHARLQQVLAAADWEDRARLARARRVEIEQRLWRAESAGLARAVFQEEVERLAAQARVAEVDLDIRPLAAHDTLSDVHLLDATLQARGELSAFIRLLGSLGSRDRPVYVRGLEFGGRRRGRAQAELQAAFLLLSDPVLSSNSNGAGR